MSDIRSIHLETAAIIDNDNHVLLAEGHNYGWELPGTKVEYGDRLDALSHALMDKLGIWVDPTETTMPTLDEVALSVAGTKLYTRIHRVTMYEGFPMETVSSGYRRTLWVNPLKLGIGRLGLSPVADHFHKLVCDNPELLTS
jgi:hypothetical protein